MAIGIASMIQWHSRISSLPMYFTKTLQGWKNGTEKLGMVFYFQQLNFFGYCCSGDIDKPELRKTWKK